MTTDVMFSSNTNEWATPMDFYTKLNMEFRFTLDPCSTHENAKCEKHYTMEDDGLKQDWSGETVFCNPPYGRDIGLWVEKSYKESLKSSSPIVMLIPARTDTRYWHEWIFDKADIRFLRGRLKFGDSKNAAPFPSAVIIYRNKLNINKETGNVIMPKSIRK